MNNVYHIADNEVSCGHLRDVTFTKMGLLVPSKFVFGSVYNNFTGIREYVGIRQQEFGALCE